MLILLSPAKTLDFSSDPSLMQATQPLFGEHTSRLVTALKTYPVEELGRLLRVSPQLAALNHQRFQIFGTQNAPHQAAIFAYQGDVYKGLAASTLSPTDLEFAQDHLRILSGLYGLLRPFDLIEPYRLEMSTPLRMPGHPTLASFWKQTLQDALTPPSSSSPLLINLASLEYSKALTPEALGNRLIHIEFQEWHRGAFKVIGLHAKRARGLMARYIIQHQLHTPEQLCTFQMNGYHFDEQHSDPTHYLFKRTQAS